MRGVVLAVVAVGLVAGCSGSGGTPQAVAPPAGVTVSLLQYRSDQPVRRVQIKVRNDGRAPVTVAGATLTAAGFVGGIAWRSTGGPDDAVISPGEATDLPVSLPSRVTCGGSEGGGAPGSVTLALRERSKVVTTTELPATDQFGALKGVHDQECLEQAAAGIAKIELVEPLRSEGGRTYLDLRFTPTGKPGSVTIEKVRSTTLLDPPRGDAWPLDTTVSSAGGPVTVGLLLHPARCDPHAVAEDKLGTVMNLTMHVDGGRSGAVDYPANPRLRAEIQNWVGRTCGLQK